MDELKRLQKLAGLIHENEEDDEWNLVAGPEWNDQNIKVEWRYWHYNAYIADPDTKGTCPEDDGFDPDDDDFFADVYYSYSFITTRDKLSQAISESDDIDYDIKNKIIDFLYKNDYTEAASWMTENDYSSDLDNQWSFVYDIAGGEPIEHKWVWSNGDDVNTEDYRVSWCNRVAELGSEYIITSI